MTEINDPLVFKEHNEWFHYDETFIKENKIGSFKTEEEAAQSFIQYFENLTGCKISTFLKD